MTAGAEMRRDDRAESSGAEALTERPAIDQRAARLIQPEQAIRLRMAPFRIEEGRLHAAALDPNDYAAADELSVVTGMAVSVFPVSQALFGEMLREAFGVTAAQMAARLAVGPGEGEGDLASNIEAVEAEELHRMAEQPTLINLVNLLILEAIRGRASDIHIEPFEKTLTVKYRIDGVLVAQSPPPKHLQPAITSRVKVMAGMNIAERYVPQDGHIALRFEGRKVDIRVSTVPTLYGESVVMRVLDKESVSLDLEALGMRGPDRASMDRLIALPHGMALVTGPTGSGKTTTLYAALSKLYDPGKKIITIEDPVEYELGGVNQIPVNPKRGLTFATGLRSILRQDPDIIMVGEIRDRETAEIAVRSALTGHLLFSTLHTNDAVSAIGRLLDMGVEPFLLASVLEGVVAQRLGRRLCRHCRARAPIGALGGRGGGDGLGGRRLTPGERGFFPEERAWRSVGCEKCENTGFRGRVGFYEVLRVNAMMREAIVNRVSGRALTATASADHVTMRTDGLMKAAEGVTTVEEVLRATQDVGDEA